MDHKRIGIVFSVCLPIMFFLMIRDIEHRREFAGIERRGMEALVDFEMMRRADESERRPLSQLLGDEAFLQWGIDRILAMENPDEVALWALEFYRRRLDASREGLTENVEYEALD